jgi:UPF0755 protein
MRKLIVILSISTGFCVAVGYISLNAYLNTTLEVSAHYEVKKGIYLKAALEQLAHRNILNRPMWLYAVARLKQQSSIRVGHYTITPKDTPLTLLDKLHRGRVNTETFTLAEGMNRWQVKNLLEKDAWISPEDFDALCDNQEYLTSHQIPGPTCEGYLFPETYTFARGVSGKKLLGAMFKLYRKHFLEATGSGNGPMALGEQELMTLASIIEKETGDASERPRIACLFYNRLKAKPPWRLQTDPTVIYAATLHNPNFDGNIRRYHLHEMEHPYNTYKRFGLPPGPIANPGREAMEAVVHPSECSDFFFVSMNNGRHVFCPTLDCHNKAVQKWQINYHRKK